MRYDADSDTSSTGFEGTDGDQYGSDGEAQFDPFWSTSESDGEDNDALAIHTLLADTTFNDEIVSCNSIFGFCRMSELPHCCEAFANSQNA